MKRFITLLTLLFIAVSLFSQRTADRFMTLGCSISQSGSSSGKPHVSCNCVDQGGTYDASNVQVGDSLMFVDSGVGYKLPVDSIVTPGTPTVVVRVDWTGLGLVMIPTGSGALSRGASNGIDTDVAGLSDGDAQVWKEDNVANFDFNNNRTYVTSDSFSTFVPSTPTPQEGDLVLSLPKGNWYQKVSGNWVRKSLENGTTAASIYSAGSVDTLTWNANLYRHVRVNAGTRDTVHIDFPTNMATQFVGSTYLVGVQNGANALTVTWDTLYGKFDYTDMPDQTLSANSTINYQFRVVADGSEGVRLQWVDGGQGGVGVTDGDKGDIVVAGSGGSWTLDTDIKNAINYKYQRRSINNLAQNEVPVFILTGQSNAEGGGDDSSATAGELDANTNVKIWEGWPGGSGTWADLNIGANYTNGRDGIQHGAELEWQNIRDTFFPDKRLYIIKHAVGATGIDPSHLPDGAVYDSLWVNYVQSAINNLIDSNLIPVVSFYFMQGETEANSGGSAAINYESNLRKLISNWQRNISPDMPIIIGRVDHGSYIAQDTIRDAQIAVANDFNLIASFSTNGFTKKDADHFDYAGQKLLARAFYDALVDTFNMPGVRIYEKLPRGQAMAATGNGILAGGSLTMDAVATITSQAGEDISFNSPTTSPLLKIEVDNDRVEFGGSTTYINTDGRIAYNKAASADLTRALRDNRGGTTLNNTGGLAYGDYMQLTQSGTAITAAYNAEIKKNGGASGNILGFWSNPQFLLGSTAAAGWSFRAETPAFSGGATVTDMYGFYSNAQTATGVTNAWGFYQVGASDKNYFQGNTGFGTTTITEKINVSGNIGITGVIKSGDGTAAAPPYSFTSDTGMGMYRGGTNQIKWSTSGTERMSLTLGVLNVGTGYKINNLAPSGQYIRGDGTNGVFSAIQAADIPDLGSTYWKLGGQATGGTATIGPSDNQLFKIQTNSSERIGLTSDSTRILGRLSFSVGSGNRYAWGTDGVVADWNVGTYTDISSTGSPAMMVGYSFDAPTFAASNVITPTNTATVRIDGAPNDGTNVTTTNKYALLIDAGKTRFDDQVRLPGSGLGDFPQLTFNDGSFNWGLGTQSGYMKLMANDSAAILVNNFGEVGINANPVSTWALNVSSTNGTGDGALKVTGNHLYTLLDNENPAYEMNYFDAGGTGSTQTAFSVSTSNGNETVEIGDNSFQTLINGELSWPGYGAQDTVSYQVGMQFDGTVVPMGRTTGSMTMDSVAYTLTATGGGVFDWVTNGTNTLWSLEQSTSYFTLAGDSIVIHKDGDYLIDYDMSFASGNSSDYTTTILLNDVAQTRGKTFRGMSGTDSGVIMGKALLRDLSSGDVIKIGIREDAGTTDPIFYYGDVFIEFK